jgi:hypothetical protein
MMRYISELFYPWLLSALWQQGLQKQRQEANQLFKQQGQEANQLFEQAIGFYKKALELDPYYFVTQPCRFVNS